MAHFLDCTGVILDTPEPFTRAYFTLKPIYAYWLPAPLAVICLCTDLRCLARVWMMSPMAGEVEGGEEGDRKSVV